MNDPQLLSSERVCGVCGAKALGYNFNAITCESCKAFFRRNAIRDEKFQCPFSGRCSIDSVTRKFCQRCRLDKCYRIGMRRDWIMTESEKLHKRQRRVRLRRVCRHTVDPPASVAKHNLDDDEGVKLMDCDGGGGVATAQNPTLPTIVNSQMPDAASVRSRSADSAVQASLSSSRVNAATNTTPVSDNCRHHDNGCTNECICDVSCSCSNCLEISRVAVAAEFCDTVLRTGDNCCDKTPRPPSGGRTLNYIEERKLSEMVTAFGALTTPLNDDNQFVNMVSSDPSLINLINLCDVAVRRLVKMAKMLQPFCELCQKDQIALLKGGCTELMILCGVSTYDSQNSSWNIPGGNTDYTSIKLSVLKKAPHDVYGAHKEFNETFCDAWKTDVRLMSLLVAVTLFCPSRPHLQHVQAVKMEQESYFYLLRRYLLCIMGGCEGREHYSMAVEKLRQLRQLNEDHIKIFMDVNPCHVEPLLIEVFDLDGAQQATTKASVNFSASVSTPYMVIGTNESSTKKNIFSQSSAGSANSTEMLAANYQHDLIPEYLTSSQHHNQLSTQIREQYLTQAMTGNGRVYKEACATLVSTASGLSTATVPVQLVKRQSSDSGQSLADRNSLLLDRY